MGACQGLSVVAANIEDMASSGMLASPSASSFSKRLSALGCKGTHKSNLSRDFMVLAKTELQAKFSIYLCKTVVRCPKSVIQDTHVGMLLPHEFAHLWWKTSRPTFDRVFAVLEIQGFWERTIAVNEEWFSVHPLREQINLWTDLSG